MKGTSVLLQKRTSVLERGKARLYKVREDKVAAEFGKGVKRENEKSQKIYLKNFENYF